MPSLPEDLMWLLHQFAGPWTLEQAIVQAYDHCADSFSDGEKVCFPICNYDHQLTRDGWSLFIEINFTFRVYGPKETSQLTLKVTVERDDWPGDGLWEMTFDFWSLEEILAFLPRLGELLPKSCELVERQLWVEVDTDDYYIFYPRTWPEWNSDIFSSNSFPALLRLL